MAAVGTAEGHRVRPGDRDHARDERGWVGRALVSLLVVALVGGGLAAWRLDLVEPWYDHLFSDDPAPATGPDAIPPPPGLELPALTAPPPVEPPLTPPGPIDATLVEQALAPYLADPALGRHVVAAVADLTARRPVVRVGDGVAAVPASTTKLLTATAALAALGPETRFATRVVAGGKGRIVLVGGGDPFLASKPPPGSVYPERADVETLAAQTAAVLRQQGRTRVALGYDDSLFSEPSFNPAWPDSYLTENVVSRITALWVDEGRPAVGSARVDDPSLYAAQTFAAALVAQGIEVVGPPTHGVATGGRDLASVESAPLREIVARVLEVSDNEAAEVLSHQVGKAVTGTGSFADGAAAIIQTLQGLGVPTRGIEVYDGSGLSRENRITADGAGRRAARGVRPGAPGAERCGHGAAGRGLHRLPDQSVRRAVPRVARAGAGQDRQLDQREQPGRDRGRPGRPRDALRAHG